MTNIIVYDDTAEKLEELSKRLDQTIAEIIDSLIEYSEELE